jgi:hypothetical protein
MGPRNSHLQLVRPPGIASDTGFQALAAPDLENEPLNGIEMDPGLYVPGIREWERDHCCRPEDPSEEAPRPVLDPIVLPAEPVPELAPEGLVPIEARPDMELPGLLPPAKGDAWNPERHLATSRRFIAHWLLAILSGVLLLAWLTLLLNLITVQEVQQLMTIMFAPIIGLVGAATGFYFGERSEERRP